MGSWAHLGQGGGRGYEGAREVGSGVNGVEGLQGGMGRGTGWVMGCDGGLWGSRDFLGVMGWGGQGAKGGM